MKLVILLSVLACGYGDKLDRTYLPPASAATAGGSPGSLIAPGTSGFNQNQQGQSGFNPAVSSGSDSSRRPAFGSPSGGALPDSINRQSGQLSDYSESKNTVPSGYTQPSGFSSTSASSNSLPQAQFGGSLFNKPAGPSSNGFGSRPFGQQSSIKPSDYSQQQSGSSPVSGQGSPLATQPLNGFGSGTFGQQSPDALSAYSSQPASNQGFGQRYQSFQPERAQAAADRNAEILRYDNEIDGDRFSYSFETSNGISAEESGVAAGGVKAQGQFSYTGDDGNAYSITYTADENGYRPQGAHLPTSPPVPEEILRSIEKNAQAAAAGTQEGAYRPEEYESENGAPNLNRKIVNGQGSISNIGSSNNRPLNQIGQGNLQYRPETVYSTSQIGQQGQTGQYNLPSGNQAGNDRPDVNNIKGQGNTNILGQGQGSSGYQNGQTGQYNLPSGNQAGNNRLDAGNIKGQGNINILGQGSAGLGSSGYQYNSPNNVASPPNRPINQGPFDQTRPQFGISTNSPSSSPVQGSSDQRPSTSSNGLLSNGITTSPQNSNYQLGNQIASVFDKSKEGPQGSFGSPNAPSQGYSYERGLSNSQSSSRGPNSQPHNSATRGQNQPRFPGSQNQLSSTNQNKPNTQYQPGSLGQLQSNFPSRDQSGLHQVPQYKPNANQGQYRPSSQTQVSTPGLGQNPVSGGASPYQYNRPAQGISRGPGSQQTGSNQSRNPEGNQPRSEFGGPRQPPSFSSQEGYKY